MSFNEKFQAGESYGDAKTGSTSLLDDPIKLATDIIKEYAGVRTQASIPQLAELIKELTIEKGKPLDDKKG